MKFVQQAPGTCVLPGRWYVLPESTKLELIKQNIAHQNSEDSSLCGKTLISSKMIAHSTVSAGNFRINPDCGIISCSQQYDNKMDPFMRACMFGCMQVKLIIHSNQFPQKLFKGFKTKSIALKKIRNHHASLVISVEQRRQAVLQSSESSLQRNNSV